MADMLKKIGQSAIVLRYRLQANLDRDQIQTLTAQLAAREEEVKKLRGPAEQVVEYFHCYALSLTNLDKPHQEHFLAQLDAWVDNLDNAIDKPDSADTKSEGEG